MPTLNFSFTVSEVNKARIINGVCYQNNYRDQIEDPENEGEMIANPETKAQFAKRMIKEYIKNNVRAYEVSKAVSEARKAKMEEVDDNIVLVDV